MSDSSTHQESSEALATTSSMKELARQQEEKKSIVIHAVQGFCNDDSPYEVLRTIAEALKNGSDNKLTAKVISGGKTNFSYKVHLEKSPQLAVFAKISFNYALWDPTHSPTYDVKRTENEFWLAREFAKMMEPDAPVAIPFHLVKLCENSRLIITEWAKADEQWCNQFIDGQVDERLIPKVARALAKFNTTTIEGFVDPNFNDNAGRIPHLLIQSNKDIFRDLITGAGGGGESQSGGANAGGGDDVCLTAMKEFGVENYTALMDSVMEAYNQRDVLCHNDAHCFNMLVEKKPSQTLQLPEKFGPNGNFVLCDWEMACVGARGADAGRMTFFPIACAMCHAVQGHKDEAYHLIDFCEKFHDEYLQALVEYGGFKFEKELIATFRSSLGFTGTMLHPVMYQMRIFCDVAPLQDVSEQDAQLAIGAAGLIGLTYLQYGFGNLEPDLTLAEIRGKQREMLMRHVDALLAHGHARPRRLSVLRAIGRRVSDASLYDEETVMLARRLSAEHATCRRRSTLLGPLIGLNLLEGDDASLMFSESSHDDP